MEKETPWLARLALAYVAAVALFYLGGGWYYAAEIRSDALAITESSPQFDMMVVDASASTLTLARGETGDLLSNDVLGVAWGSGYGQVREVIELGEETVTRRYVHLQGDRPRPGEMVDLDGFAFPEDPRRAHGLEFSTVTYASPLGAMEAWLVPGASETWVVFVHGRGTDSREALRAIPSVAAAGNPSLTISYRNDPGQPESADGLARFGVTEWEDVQGAVAYALANGAEDVVLFGFSMGGAATIHFMENSVLAGRVKGLVLDAPALDLERMIDSRAASTNLPMLPFRVPDSLTWVAKRIAGDRYDIAWDDYALVSRAADLNVPVLLIHGTADESVPIELSDEMAALASANLTYRRFDGAGHVRAWNSNPDRYERAIGGFLELVDPPVDEAPAA